MTLVKEPGCDSDEVTRKVLTLVHEARQVTDVGAELSFTLPSNATPHFPQLFEALDCNIDYHMYIVLLNSVSVFCTIISKLDEVWYVVVWVRYT